MKEITKTILEDYPLNKITKFLFNKSLEKEDVVEGVIIDTTLANVILEGVSDKAKGRGLTEKKYIEGNLQVILDKNNYNILLEELESFNYKEEDMLMLERIRLIQRNIKLFSCKIGKYDILNES